MSTEREELEARLRAAREARAALEAEKARRHEEHELAREVEAEERALANEQAIAKVEEQHGPIDDRKLGRVDAECGVVIVKRPNHLHFKRFIDTGEAKTQDIEKLLRPCLVYPDGGTFDRWVEEEPFLLTRAANKVAELAGVRRREVAGK